MIGRKLFKISLMDFGVESGTIYAAEIAIAS